MKVFFDVITNHTADVVDYEEKSYDYLSKGAFPYLTKDGKPFDDADYADGSRTFPRVDAGSFPRTPTVPAAKKNVKVPSWLNDPAMYHNRGDSTFAGESSEYGDFSGLDDLWTERRGRRRHGEDLPAVGEGLRHRRLPDRHREARQHGVLDPVGHRPGRLRGEEGA